MRLFGLMNLHTCWKDQFLLVLIAIYEIRVVVNSLMPYWDLFCHWNSPQPFWSLLKVLGSWKNTSKEAWIRWMRPIFGAPRDLIYLRHPQFWLPGTYIHTQKKDGHWHSTTTSQGPRQQWSVPFGFFSFGSTLPLSVGKFACVHVFIYICLWWCLTFTPYEGLRPLPPA